MNNRFGEECHKCLCRKAERQGKHCFQGERLSIPNSLVKWAALFEGNYFLIYVIQQTILSNLILWPEWLHPIKLMLISNTEMKGWNYAFFSLFIDRHRDNLTTAIILIHPFQWCQVITIVTSGNKHSLKGQNVDHLGKAALRDMQRVMAQTLSLSRADG